MSKGKNKRDYYEILTVERTASDGEIKSAYRKLALKYHPDRNPGDHDAEESFKECAEAYSILADPDKRAAYDRFGHAGVPGAEPLPLQVSQVSWRGIWIAVSLPAAASSNVISRS